jgi:hypothetical protein
LGEAAGESPPGERSSELGIRTGSPLRRLRLCDRDTAAFPALPNVRRYGLEADRSGESTAPRGGAVTSGPHLGHCAFSILVRGELTEALER